MSDVMQITKKPTVAAPAPTPRVYTLPFKVSLPTRFYGRLAIEEVGRAFAEIATTETKVVEGAFEVTFKHVDSEAGADVIDEFLNHVLYRSATAGEDGAR